MIVVGNILAWSGLDTFFVIVYVYANEIIGGKLRSLSNGILFLFWGLGEIFFNFIISYFKKLE